MARKKKTEDTSDTSEQTEQKELTTVTSNLNIPETDSLPLNIPDSDTRPVMFAHKAIRAVMSKPRIEQAKPTDWWYREGKDTYAYLCDFMIREDQPDHPELSEIAGFRLGYNRFIIDPAQRSQEIYLSLCRAYGQKPNSPQMSAFEDVAVVINVKTTIKTDPETGEEQPPRHNINKVLRDVEYEQAHGG